MIIECPACTTRYNINAVFPPGGKTVRCAKCGQVWRALPVTGEEEGEDVSGAGETAAGADASSLPVEDVAPAVAASGEYPNEVSGTVERDPAPAAMQFSGADAAAATYRGGEIAVTPPFDEDMPPMLAPATGKVRFFGGFRRKSEPARDEVPRPFGQNLSRPSAEPIPFPRSGPQADTAPPGADPGEVQTLEEARAAVRSVFSSLADPKSASARGRSYAMPVLSAASQDADAPEAAGEAFSAGENGFGETRGNGASEGGVNPEDTGEPGETSDWHIPAAGHEDEEGRLRTTAQELGEAIENYAFEQQAAERNPDGATLRQLSSHGFEEEVEEAADSGNGQEADAETDSFLRAAFAGAVARRDSLHAAEGNAFSEDRLAEELRSRLQGSQNSAEAGQDPDREVADGLWSRPRMPAGVLGGSGFERDLEGDPGEAEVEARGEADDFDERLFRNMENREFRSGPSRRKSGGLALAAGWGLFLCAASGLVAGFFAFRDITAAALPGLAPVYQAAGLPVTVQPLAFENVGFTWETEGPKPVLRVRGSVVNRAQRKVKVPSFFVLVRDANPELDREYSVSLTSSGKIKSGQHADFDIQLISVTPAITAVELELRSVR